MAAAEVGTTDTGPLLPALVLERRPLALDSESLLYVYVPYARHILRYDPAGRLLGVIGGRGEGPGEFRGAVSLGLVGDTLWAVERRPVAPRLTLFTPEGEILNTTTLETVAVQMASNASGVVVPEFVQSESGLLVTGSMVGFRGSTSPGSGIEPEDDVTVPRVRYDLAGNVVDTIGWYPRTARPTFASDVPQRELVRVGDLQYVVPHPPDLEPLRVLTAYGDLTVLVGTEPDPGGPAITVVSRRSDGRIRFEEKFGFSPHPYPPDVIDSLALESARRPAYRLSNGAIVQPEEVDLADDQAERTVRALVEATQVPPFRPPVTTIRLGGDGTVWLRIQEEPDAPDSLWLGLEATGAALGLVRLPKATEIGLVSDRTMWAVSWDETSVPMLERYEFSGPRTPN